MDDKTPTTSDTLDSSHLTSLTTSVPAWLFQWGWEARILSANDQCFKYLHVSEQPKYIEMGDLYTNQLIYLAVSTPLYSCIISPGMGDKRIETTT